jgi:hypothetical protein
MDHADLAIPPANAFKLLGVKPPDSAEAGVSKLVGYQARPSSFTQLVSREPES